MFLTDRFSAAALTSPFDSPSLLSEAVSPSVQGGMFGVYKKLCVFWHWPIINTKAVTWRLSLSVVLTDILQTDPGSILSQGQESVSRVFTITYIYILALWELGLRQRERYCCLYGEFLYKYFHTNNLCILLSNFASSREINKVKIYTLLWVQCFIYQYANVGTLNCLLEFPYC